MIIGIAGSFGAGKGAVVEYLKSKGFTHFSSSGLITEEIIKRGLPVNRDSMILVGNDLRAEHGPAYIIETNFRRAQSVGGDVILEALRAVAEVRKIKELGGFVLGVDADPKVRYAHISHRAGEKDDVPYDVWLAQERKESNPDDPTKQDIFGALKESDAMIFNNGTFEELYAQVDAVLAKIATK